MVGLKFTKKILVLLILIFLVLPVSACLKNKSAQPAANQPKILTAAEQQTQYESALKEILKSYFQDNKITGIKDKILELKAPGQYLDLHLNLVITFELLEQGKAGSDQAKIEQGLDKINKLKSQYSWVE